METQRWRFAIRLAQAEMKSKQAQLATIFLVILIGNAIYAPHLLAQVGDLKQGAVRGETPFGDGTFINQGDVEQILNESSKSTPAQVVDRLLKLALIRRGDLSTSIYYLSDELAFDPKVLAKVQRWRDALLSFSRNPKDINERAVYDALLEKRSAAARSLTFTLNALRGSDSEIDPDRELRRDLRSKVAALAWEGELNDEQAKTLGEYRTKIRTSLNEVGRIHTGIGSSDDELSAFHSTGDDLLLHLDNSTALVDLYKYEDLAVGPSATAKKSHRYCAFVVSTTASNEKRVDSDRLSPSRVIERPAEDAKIARVELGAAETIESTVNAWLDEIRAGRDGLKYANQLSQLIWAPLSASMADVPKTVYFCAGGTLERVPWGALPIEGGKSILLEKVQVARLPYPQMIIKVTSRYDRQLPEMFVVNDLLAVGDIDSKDLPHASRETEFIVNLARDFRPDFQISDLRNAKATPSNVAQDLERSRVAVFSLHGSQATTALRTAQAKGVLRHSTLNELDGLLFSALHLKPDSPNRPFAEQLLVADSVTELNCSHLQLVVLSACATARGSNAQGEPRLSMTQAFHLAGCPNVISTLWDTDDAAARKLMEEFFRLYFAKESKTPIEALCEAQAILYRSKIRLEKSGSRDPLNPKKTVTIDKSKKIDQANPEGEPITTRHWASFIISGVGK